MISQQAINEYKKIYFEVFGIELSDIEASLRASNLIRLYQIVYGAELIALEQDEYVEIEQ